jgi:3-phytase
VNARPEGPLDRDLVDHTLGAHLNADVEGLSLYRHGGRTLLLASSQGDNSYAVYDVSKGDAYLGSFRIGDNKTAGVDGATETDGIDSSERLITDRFPAGVLVVQDGVNTPEGERQNFKLVSMADVIALF